MHQAEFVPGQTVPLFELKPPVFEAKRFLCHSSSCSRARASSSGESATTSSVSGVSLRPPPRPRPSLPRTAHEVQGLAPLARKTDKIDARVLAAAFSAHRGGAAPAVKSCRGGSSVRVGCEVVEFRLLGPLEAVVDGAPVRLGPPQQRALLALLLLNANEVVSRDRIVDELWGERPPATAIKLVQVYVSALRKVLEPRRPRDPPARLPPAGRARRASTSSRFQRHVDEGGAALGAGAPAAAAEHFRQALALWRGPALADFAFAPFAQAEIARLDELRLGGAVRTASRPTSSWAAPMWWASSRR